MRSARWVSAAGMAAGLGGVLWWRYHPSACPYGQRLWLELPRPALTRNRLVRNLRPAAGEQVLEVGVGTGFYVAAVAGRVQPDGNLTVVDMQQAMLQHTMRQAAAQGLTPVVTPVLSDACSLPFEDGSFDAAYLVTVLGEIPDQDAALGEVHRVLRAGGRLVVGEIALDPHMVRFSTMQKRAERAGLRFAGRDGGPAAFFARYVRP